GDLPFDESTLLDHDDEDDQTPADEHGHDGHDVGDQTHGDGTSTVTAGTHTAPRAMGPGPRAGGRDAGKSVDVGSDGVRR
ncbi:hypothetical protein, partial [Pedococcus sp. 5OH_020]|uniref:hypothetical protein n=1 Tax=Pedococcus sp. 5OH_020 TaxID=2989814 RepID=UPI0022E9A1E2